MTEDTPDQSSDVEQSGALSVQSMLALALAVLILSATGVAATVVLDASGAANQPAGDSTTWPQDQYDDARTGHTDATTGPKGPVETKWTTELTDDSNPSPISPVLQNGTIYVGSNDGNVSAFHASNGTHIWTSRIEEWDDIMTLTVANDTLYVSGMNNVFALDPETGAEVWTQPYSLDGDDVQVIGSQIVVRNDRLFVAARNTTTFEEGYLYAINATTGTLAWRFETDYLWEGGVAYSNDTVYVGVGEDNSNSLQEDNVGGIYAINASSGSLRWSKHYSSADGLNQVRVRASPTVANGTVFVAKENGDLVAYDEDTGTERWNTTVGGADVVNSPAVANGVVYVATKEPSEVQAFDADTGKAVWSAPFDVAGDASSPVVVDGVLYVGGGGDVYGIHPENGTVRFTHAFGVGEPATPVVVNGTIYVHEGSWPGRLHAIGDVVEPANYLVTVNDTNSPVEEGQTLTVSVDVTNGGDSQGQQNVSLTVDGVVRDSQSVTLTPDAKQTLTLEWTTGTGDAGNYTATVASDNATDTASVSVQAPSTTTTTTTTTATTTTTTTATPTATTTTATATATPTTTATATATPTATTTTATATTTPSASGTTAATANATPTTTPTPESNSTPEPADGSPTTVETQTTETGAPGFGLVTAIVAFLVTIALARWR